LSAFLVPAEYRSLHKYLAERYADIVVLTFAQIEDLLGFRLPPSAWVHLTWWADDEANHPESTQSRAWTQANRSATPNLSARTVMFERLHVRPQSQTI
jgi:hypothetical protein